MKAVPAGQHLGMLCSYMQSKIGIPFDPNACNGFAILGDDGSFKAAVLVTNVRCTDGVPIDCEISCAAETSIAWQPEVCRAVFQYIFGQLGCIRCTSITTKNNTRTRKFLEHLKFELEGNARKGYDGKHDALIYGLLREDCQFFGGFNG